MERILIVDDEKKLLRSLEDFFSTQGYEVLCAARGDEAVRIAMEKAPDLLILDIMLPDISGYDVCRQVKAKLPSARVIMLSAKGEEMDKVLGLELGADDYMTKPFGFRELVARIRAVGRRTVDAQPDAATPGEPAVAQRIGELTVDRRTRRAHIGGEEIFLTAKEFDLLARTRTEIIENVWDAHWYGPTKTVDAHVASLRKKLGSHEWIQAVRGVGFRLEPPA